MYGKKRPDPTLNIRQGSVHQFHIVAHPSHIVTHPVHIVVHHSVSEFPKPKLTERDVQIENLLLRDYESRSPDIALFPLALIYLGFEQPFLLKKLKL